jgi:D-alanyl-D-alanine carboxypeptidase
VKSSKRYRFSRLFFFTCALVITSLVAFAARQSSRNQSNKPVAENEQGMRIERLSAPAKPTSEAAPRSSVFDLAARRNAELQAGLNWQFGGKVQRGWQLYTPLIAKTIDVKTAASSNEFAARLARWQQTNGLQSHGMLDNYTMSQIISVWQSRRIQDRAYPSPDQLVTIPVTECYDPERPAELRQVERRAYDAYKRMIAAAAADPSLGLQVTRNGQLAADEKFLKVVSAFRSREYQEHLRQQSPHSGRAGLAVNSPHFTGRALDLYVGGEPVSTKDENRALQTQTKVYQWLVQNAGRFGFQPYFYEPWHWEYVGEGR